MRCTNSYTDKRLEQAQRAIFAAVTAQIAAAEAPSAAPAQAAQSADLERAQCTVPVRVYDSEAGQRKVIGMIRLSDAIRLSESGRRVEVCDAEAPAAPTE